MAKETKGLRKAILSDMLGEVGQGLDCSENGWKHACGQIMLFIASVANGNTPQASAQSVIDYQAKYERGESPYGPTPDGKVDDVGFYGNPPRPRFETRKMDVLYLVSKNGRDLACYCSQCGFCAMVENLDPDLEGDMSDHLGKWGGTKDGSYEMSE